MSQPSTQQLLARSLSHAHPMSADSCSEQSLEPALTTRERELAAAFARASAANEEAGLKLDRELKGLSRQILEWKNSGRLCDHRQLQQLGPQWKAIEERYADAYRALCRQLDQDRVEIEARYAAASST